MTAWLDQQILQQDFVQMKEWNINFLRLPLGYWNVLDMQGNPNAPSQDADRMGNLNTIMPSYTEYRPYIDKIFEYAKENDIFVMLDLHGAPGNQNGDSHGGCHVQSPYWNTDWNKLWSRRAVLAMVEICKVNTNCYGVEVLNEPSSDLSRSDLIAYYQEVILASREAGLPMETPMIIMDWNYEFTWHFNNKWYELFPVEKYGQTIFDTHIYDFKNTVADEEASWDKGQWPPVSHIAS